MTPHVSPTLAPAEKPAGAWQRSRTQSALGDPGGAVYAYNFARLSELGFLYVTSDQLVGGPW